MASPYFQNIVIIGATGTIGPSITDQLLLNGEHFKRITAVTTSEVDHPKFSSIKSRGVRVVQANFDDKQSLVDAFKGHDVVISAVGPNVWKKQTLFIDAAIEVGVKHFIPAEFGLDCLNPNIGEFVLDEKRVILKYLENYANQGKISYTVFVTGIFLDWGLKTGFLGFDLTKHEAILYDEGKNKFVATNVDEIARFVVASIKHPELSTNKNLHIGTVSVTQLEVLHSLEKITGEKWTIKEHVKIQELKKQIPELLAKGDFAGIKYTVLSILYRGDVDYPLDDNKLFPEVKTLTLDQSVELVVKGL